MAQVSLIQRHLVSGGKWTVHCIETKMIALITIVRCNSQQFQIEGVQKLALKICTKQWTTSYSTLLTLTIVPSLEKRRQIL